MDLPGNGYITRGVKLGSGTVMILATKDCVDVVENTINMVLKSQV